MNDPPKPNSKELPSSLTSLNGQVVICKVIGPVHDGLYYDVSILKENVPIFTTVLSMSGQTEQLAIGQHVAAQLSIIETEWDHIKYQRMFLSGLAIAPVLGDEDDAQGSAVRRKPLPSSGDNNLAIDPPRQDAANET